MWVLPSNQIFFIRINNKIEHMLGSVWLEVFGGEGRGGEVREYY
jgi:hypothetical protein